MERDICNYDKVYRGMRNNVNGRDLHKHCVKNDIICKAFIHQHLTL